MGWKLLENADKIHKGLFKSHHSGMETGYKQRAVSRIRGPLNRTIVGWKLALRTSRAMTEGSLNRTIVGWKRGLFPPHPTPADALNRTIVGWKQYLDRLDAWETYCFKAHHSGMETTARMGTLNVSLRL